MSVFKRVSTKILLALCFLWHINIYAGEEFQINTYTSSDQVNPAAASFSDGNFVVVWDSKDQDTDDCGIYGRIFDSLGTPITSEIPINTTTTGYQKEPAVAVLSNGDFVVTWTDETQDGSSTAIYGRIFNSSGIPVTGEFRVNTYTVDRQLYSFILPLNNDGNFVVVFSSEGFDGESHTVVAQVFDSSGSKVGGEFQINTFTTLHQTLPTGAVFSNNNFVVVWQSFSQDTSEYGIFGRIFNSSGTPITDEFQINSYIDKYQQHSSVTILNNNNFVVTWESEEQDSHSFGIYGQMFDSSGNKIGDEFQINTYTTYNQRYSSIATLSNNNFVVTWESESQDGSGYGIYGQIFDSSGNKLGSEFQINTTTAGDQLGHLYRGPALAPLPNSDFVVAWASSDGDGHGIFGRIFDLYSINTDQTLNYSEDASESFQAMEVFSPNIDVNITMTLSDSSAGTLNSGFSYNATSSFENGKWQAWGTIDGLNELLGNLTFIPAPDYDKNFNIDVLIIDKNSNITDTINVIATPFNDSPEITTSDTVLSYTNFGSKIIDGNLNITDIDNDFLQSATITMQGNVDVNTDSLGYSSQNGIEGYYNSETGELLLIGNATIENYQEALRTVTYESTADLLPIKNLTVSYAVNDGFLNSNAATRNIQLGKLYALNTNQTVNYIEDLPKTLAPIKIYALESSVNTALTMSDKFSGSLSTDSVSGATSTYNSNSGKWEAWGTIDGVNSLFEDLTFTPEADYNDDFNIDVLIDSGSSYNITDTISVYGTPDLDATNINQSLNYIEDIPKKLLPIVITSPYTNVDVTLTLTDSSAGSLNTASSGSTTSTYDTNLGVWNAFGPKDEVNDLLADLAFTPTEDYNSDFTINVLIEDEASTDISGTINGTGTPDLAVTNTNQEWDLVANTPVQFFPMVVSSPYPNVNVTLTLSDILAGVLNEGVSGSVTSVYNANTGEWQTWGAVDNVNTLLSNLTFTPSLDYHKDFSIETSIKDVASSDVTGEINIIGYNHLPTVQNIIKEGEINKEIALIANDFIDAFDDEDQDSLTQIKITHLSEHGELKLLTTPVNLNEEIGVSNLGELVFYPDTGWTGETEIGWQGSDGFGYSTNSAQIVLKIIDLDSPLESPIDSSGDTDYSWIWGAGAGIAATAVTGTALTAVGCVGCVGCAACVSCASSSAAVAATAGGMQCCYKRSNIKGEVDIDGEGSADGSTDTDDDDHQSMDDGAKKGSGDVDDIYGGTTDDSSDDDNNDNNNDPRGGGGGAISIGDLNNHIDDLNNPSPPSNATVDQTSNDNTLGVIEYVGSDSSVYD